MSQASVQEEILETLTGLKQEVNHLKVDMHNLIEYLEDTRLTEEEKELLDQSIAKIKAGDESGFVSHQDIKRKLGI